MKKIFLALTLLITASSVNAQKVDSIYFHLYTDSLKKGTYNYINVDGNSDIMAEKSGLLVIKATGESARITNKKDFKPKEW